MSARHSGRLGLSDTDQEEMRRQRLDPELACLAQRLRDDRSEYSPEAIAGLNLLASRVQQHYAGLGYQVKEQAAETAREHGQALTESAKETAQQGASDVRDAAGEPNRE